MQPKKKKKKKKKKAEAEDGQFVGVPLEGPPAVGNPGEFDTYYDPR